jgi:hypothetical protein
MREGLAKWCGCGPTEGATTRTGQPFSTDELEPGAGSQAIVEWPKPGPPATTTQLASAPRDVVMNQRYDQGMREEPVDWTKLIRLVPRRKPDVHGMTLDGKTVLLDLSTGRSYRLNSVGTAVWEQCDGSATLFDIQVVLRSRCELSPERAHDEVVSLVLQLGHDGLIS